jgi:hypothetical protein
MTIINLTSEERWKLGTAQFSGYITLYDRDQRMRQTLLALGVVEPISSHRVSITPLGQEALEYLETKRNDELVIWEALLQIVEDLKKANPSAGNSRLPGEYLHHEDGRIQGSTRFTTFNTDGTQTNHQITGILQDGHVTTRVHSVENTRDAVWGPGGDMDSDDDAGRRIIVNHTVYYISPDTTGPSYCAGFGGRRWEIEYLDDGRRKVSHNLWQSNTVPPKWRERWPDTARFIPEPPRPSLADRLGLKAL